MKIMMNGVISAIGLLLFPVVVMATAAEEKTFTPKAVENSAAKLTPPAKEAPKLEPAKNPAALQDKFIDLSLNFSNGYRADHFKHDLGKAPNILSELTWKDLDTYEIKGSGNMLIAKLFYIRGSVDYGKILNGRLQDSDFNGQNKTDEYSRTRSETDGHVFDSSIGGGIQWRPKLTKILTFSPLAGWSYHEQKFSDSHFNQLIDTEGGLTGPFPSPFNGTGITYKTKWRGPWVGFDSTLEATPKLIFNSTFEFHFADFRGVDNHLFREDFAHPVSALDTGDADGIIVVGGAKYFLFKNLALTLNVGYQTWTTHGATTQLFNADGTSEKNAAKDEWWSVDVLGGATWRF